MNKDSTTVKVAKNTIYQVAGKVVSMSITMLAIVIITRVYGREGYGAFSLMQSWPALFFVIVDFGINAIATRELSKDFSKASKYIGNIFLIRIVFSLALIILLNIAVSFFPYAPDLKLGVRLALFMILGHSLFTTQNIIFQVRLRYDYSQLSYGIGYVVILLMVLFLSYLKVHIMWVNFSYLLGGFLGVFIALKYLKSLGVTIKLEYDKKLWGYLFSSALPLGIMFVFSQISFKEDAIMISALKLPASYGLNNTESVAVYALPYKIFEVLIAFNHFFMNAMYPILVQKMTVGEGQLKATFTKVIKLVVGLGLVSGIIGVIFAPVLINLIGGSQFYQSIDVLRILSSGIVIFYLTAPISWLIVTLGYQKFLPWVYVVSASFNMIANFIFIPKYSFYAASIITVVSELIILVLLIFTARKSWKLKYA
ncbi:flippase [Patescibacteria group bacterium]|nr:flippase [Patescibacteria group bacterium]